MSAIIGILIIAAVIGLAAWIGSRTDETKGNGDNRAAATRYGPGAHL